MPSITDHPRRRGRPRSTRTADPSGGSIQTIDRALGMLELLAGADGLTLTDLAQRAGLAPSTAHRLLASMLARRFVSHDEMRGLWFIGVGAFEVGSAFLRKRRLPTIGRGVMHELMDTTGETVNLGIEDNGEVVFISQVESHGTLRAFFRSGTRAPMHASGVGKALMAEFPKARVREILHKRGLMRFTDRTIADSEALFQGLTEIHRRGWAVDDEERTLGMRCIAAPIFNEHSEPIAAISVSGPVVRITTERMAELGPLVRRSADEITASIGGHKLRD